MRSTSRSAPVSMTDTLSLLALATNRAAVRRRQHRVRVRADSDAPVTRRRRGSTTTTAASFQQLTYTLSRRRPPRHPHIVGVDKLLAPRRRRAGRRRAARGRRVVADDAERIAEIVRDVQLAAVAADGQPGRIERLAPAVVAWSRPSRGPCGQLDRVSLEWPVRQRVCRRDRRGRARVNVSRQIRFRIRPTRTGAMRPCRSAWAETTPTLMLCGDGKYTYCTTAGTGVAPSRPPAAAAGLRSRWRALHAVAAVHDDEVAAAGRSGPVVSGDRTNATGSEPSAVDPSARRTSIARQS